MSVYGYLNCHDCRQTLWLGKALDSDYRPFAFHIGGAEEPPNWAGPELNQVLWKFMADHMGHRIDVRLEDTQDELPEAYQHILADSDGTEISFGAYLAGWPGLTLGGRGRDAEPATVTDPVA